MYKISRQVFVSFLNVPSIVVASPPSPELRIPWRSGAKRPLVIAPPQGQLDGDPAASFGARGAHASQLHPRGGAGDDGGEPGRADRLVPRPLGGSRPRGARRRKHQRAGGRPARAAGGGGRAPDEGLRHERDRQRTRPTAHQPAAANRRQRHDRPLR